MSRRLPLVWRGLDVGTVPLPDSFRLPLSEIERAGLSQFLNCVLRSRSWLYDPRPGDFAIEERGEGKAAELVVVAVGRGLGPGDLGCIVGFEPAPGCEYFVDEPTLDLADRVLRAMRP